MLASNGDGMSLDEKPGAAAGGEERGGNKSSPLQPSSFLAQPGWGTPLLRVAPDLAVGHPSSKGPQSWREADLGILEVM